MKGWHCPKCDGFHKDKETSCPNNKKLDVKCPIVDGWWIIAPSDDPCLEIEDNIKDVKYDDIYDNNGD